MNYKKWLFVFLIYVMTACGPSFETPTMVFDTLLLGTTERDVTYCTTDGFPLKMDIYYPLEAGKPSPVLIQVHGGGWVEGAKESISSLVDIKALQEAGFLIVSVEYRLAPQHKFPAMIEDVKCAVRFLRAHAAEYNLDTLRFGAIGGSAGGQLVSLLGLMDDKSAFDTGEYLDYSSRVQAVVNMYGPSNLEEKYARKLFFDPMEVFGVADGSDPIFSAASPVNYVTSDDAPFLLIHGNMDTTVPPLQSRMLLKSLQEAGVPSELIIVKRAGHNLAETGEGPIDPSLDDLKTTIMLFWKEYLAN